MNSMKKYNRFAILGWLVLSLIFLPGCELIVDIFSAGVWVGITISVIVVLLLVWLVIKVVKSNLK